MKTIRINIAVITLFLTLLIVKSDILDCEEEEVIIGTNGFKDQFAALSFNKIYFIAWREEFIDSSKNKAYRIVGRRMSSLSSIENKMILIKPQNFPSDNYELDDLVYNMKAFGQNVGLIFQRNYVYDRNLTLALFNYNFTKKINETFLPMVLYAVNDHFNDFAALNQNLNIGVYGTYTLPSIDNSTWTIIGQYFNGTLSKVGQPFNIAKYRKNQINHIRTTSLPNGNAAIVWDIYKTYNNFTRSYTTFIKTVNATGTHCQTQVVDRFGNNHIRVAANSEILLIIWNTSYDIKGRIYIPLTCDFLNSTFTIKNYTIKNIDNMNLSVMKNNFLITYSLIFDLAKPVHHFGIVIDEKGSTIAEQNLLFQEPRNYAIHFYDGNVRGVSADNNKTLLIYQRVEKGTNVLNLFVKNCSIVKSNSKINYFDFFIILVFYLI